MTVCQCGHEEEAHDYRMDNCKVRGCGCQRYDALGRQTVVADVMEDDAMTKIANDALALLDEAIELLEEWEPADLDEIVKRVSIDSRRDKVLRRYTSLRIKAGTRG